VPSPAKTPRRRPLPILVAFGAGVASRASGCHGGGDKQGEVPASEFAKNLTVLSDIEFYGTSWARGRS